MSDVNDPKEELIEAVARRLIERVQWLLKTVGWLTGLQLWQATPSAATTRALLFDTQTVLSEDHRRCLKPIFERVEKVLIEVAALRSGRGEALGALVREYQAFSELVTRPRESGWRVEDQARDIERAVFNGFEVRTRSELVGDVWYLALDVRDRGIHVPLPNARVPRGPAGSTSEVRSFLDRYTTASLRDAYIDVLAKAAGL